MCLAFRANEQLDGLPVEITPYCAYRDKKGTFCRLIGIEGCKVMDCFTELNDMRHAFQHNISNMFIGGSYKPSRMRRYQVGLERDITKAVLSLDPREMPSMMWYVKPCNILVVLKDLKEHPRNSPMDQVHKST